MIDELLATLPPDERIAVVTNTNMWTYGRLDKIGEEFLRLRDVNNGGDKLDWALFRIDEIAAIYPEFIRGARKDG